MQFSEIEVLEKRYNKCKFSNFAMFIKDNHFKILRNSRFDKPSRIRTIILFLLLDGELNEQYS